jgi:hypothetical protein
MEPGEISQFATILPVSLPVVEWAFLLFICQQVLVGCRHTGDRGESIVRAREGLPFKVTVYIGCNTDVQQTKDELNANSRKRRTSNRGSTNKGQHMTGHQQACCLGDPYMHDSMPHVHYKAEFTDQVVNAASCQLDLTSN